MNVRSKEYLAAATLTSHWIGTHRPPNGKKTEPSHQSKTVQGRREKTKKEEKFSRRILKKNQREEDIISNRRFSRTIIPPLTNLAGSPLFALHQRPLAASAP